MTACGIPCVAIAKRPAPDQVAAGSSETPRVEPLGSHHIRKEFSSGVEPLDSYFRIQVGQDVRKNLAAPLVLVLPDRAIGGYYTLSATAVPAPELPADIIRRLPRYPLIPAFSDASRWINDTADKATVASCSPTRSSDLSAARSHPSPSLSTQKMMMRGDSTSARASCGSLISQ